MKRITAIFSALCLSAALSVGIAPASGTGAVTANASQPEVAELLPVDVIMYADRLEIRKIYELSPNMDPGILPLGGFLRGGYIYECADILREAVIGEEFKTVTVTETAESKTNDMDAVLALFPQYMDYSDEDGFAGNLLLNTATIKSDISGYSSYSTPYTVSRSYPNLSDADANHIPKTIDDDGLTLSLQDIRWQTDNTMNVDDYAIGDRYTALATYGGTKSSSYVSGYDITAGYSGEAVRKGVTAIRYTVIFTGAETPPPAPEPEPEPEPDTEPEQVQEPAQAASRRGRWLPVLISLLALGGSGVCAYITLKNRKGTTRYEEINAYDYTDTDLYPIGTDDEPGNGDGDV